MWTEAPVDNMEEQSEGHYVTEPQETSRESQCNAITRFPSSSVHYSLIVFPSFGGGGGSSSQIPFKPLTLSLMCPLGEERA